MLWAPALLWSAWKIAQQGREKMTVIWFIRRPRKQLCWHNTASRSCLHTPPQITSPSPVGQLADTRLTRVSHHHREVTLPHLHPVLPRCLALIWFHHQGTELAKLTVPKSKFSVCSVFLINPPQDETGTCACAEPLGQVRHEYGTTTSHPCACQMPHSLPCAGTAAQPVLRDSWDAPYSRLLLVFHLPSTVYNWFLSSLANRKISCLDSGVAL